MISPAGFSVRTAKPVRLLPKVKNLRMKCKAHHIAVAEDQILQDRYIPFDRGAQNQARRRQDDERLLFRYWRGLLVHQVAIRQFTGREK
jgi:hypothetical protein